MPSGSAMQVVAAASAVVDADLFADVYWAHSGTEHRVITGLACTGSAAAADFKFDLYIDQTYLGTYYNTNTGVPAIDHDQMPVNFIWPAGSRVRGIVRDAAATNPVYVKVDWASIARRA